ncbi:related to SET2-Histone methyltransferase [Serendipita indica DSM 11827]|uniref:Histone-lysine N-methyltransferase, H3 lysine-36 specific n=1 Tax=Serendipita indica (strain DSM 11827) TaxID=1109443 RepID=G4T5A8_SERID|nr:related to SET2-Histone methyltransferase [Serendipita indica DSM 11827]
MELGNHVDVSRTNSEALSSRDSPMPTGERRPTPSRTPPAQTKPPTSSRRPPTSKKQQKLTVQLITDYPRAEEEALRTFHRLDTNWLQNRQMAKPKIQEDAMGCECYYKPGDPLDRACGPNSDCINRLTLVECVEEECRCGVFCQNQRFQKRQYANIHVVKTEKKGYGLRAASPIKRYLIFSSADASTPHMVSSDEFIYEYIGEIINERTLERRMDNYGDEGIEHFYFMMLQKGEFIDATKKGGFGRFANHSCNPNCYVARWVVDGGLRMGIFAKRDILKDEELTFNYNADRYGHAAQPCYCGEPNCVGFIGGKTQTDVAGMDWTTIEALGIEDEVDNLIMKGAKSKKGMKIGEDFMPVLKPMQEGDVPKVLNAISQTNTREILIKLLERIKMTEEITVLRQVLRLRGLTVISSTMDEYSDDDDVQLMILETVKPLPLINRTKIEDAKIEPRITNITNSANPRLKGLAQQVLDQWSTLEIVYRIPRRLKADVVEEDIAPKVYQVETDYDNERPTKRARLAGPTLSIKPLGIVSSSRWPSSSHNSGREEPLSSTATPPQTSITPSQPPKDSLSQIIQQAMENAKKAQADQEAQKAAVAEEEQRLKEVKLLRKQQRIRDKGNRQKRPKDDKPIGSTNNLREDSSTPASVSHVPEISNKEKQLLKLVGAAVVGYLSQWKSQFASPDDFKRHAKEITEKIAELEKKGRTYQSNARLESLSEEKRAKIKHYVKSYVGKLGLQSSLHSKDPRKPLNDRTAKPILADSSASAYGSNQGSLDSPMEAETHELLQGMDYRETEMEVDGP